MTALAIEISLLAGTAGSAIQARPPREIALIATVHEASFSDWFMPGPCCPGAKVGGAKYTDRDCALDKTKLRAERTSCRKTAHATGSSLRIDSALN